MTLKWPTAQIFSCDSSSRSPLVRPSVRGCIHNLIKNHLQFCSQSCMQCVLQDCLQCWLQCWLQCCLHLNFATLAIFNLQHLQFATLAICNTCNFQHLHFATPALCNICTLQHLHIATLAICNTCDLQFAICNICNLKNTPLCKWRGPYVVSRVVPHPRGERGWVSCHSSGSLEGGCPSSAEVIKDTLSNSRAHIVCFLQLRNVRISKIS